MGIGYAASPLHRMIFADIAAIPLSARSKLPNFPVIPGLRVVPWDEIQQHLYSPSISEIVQWRAVLAEKYKPQLGEWLEWDEDSPFEDSEDVATHSDVLLRYVAAVFDQYGKQGAARRLLHRADIPENEIEAGFIAAAGRGYTGTFPQLLLAAEIWLPFERDMIIEEPDWTGQVRRFGSVFRLLSEIAAVRDFIRRSDANAATWSVERVDDPPTVLAASWQCSQTLFRLARIAAARHLPMWTTG